MTEINNNIQNTNGLNSVSFQKKHKETAENNIANDKEKNNEIKDTGILGRSQVRNAQGADIPKSVNEAVDLAEKNPALLNASESFFSSMYETFKKEGMSDDDAYMKALLAEGEMLGITDRP